MISPVTEVWWSGMAIRFSSASTATMVSGSAEATIRAERTPIVKNSTATTIIKPNAPQNPDHRLV